MGGKPGQKSALSTEVAPRFSEDFLDALDGRVRVARTLRDRLRSLTNDLGGLVQLSYQERSLCRRIVHLERLIEKKESLLAHNGTVDETIYLASLNALGSLLTKIGLKRRAKQIPSLSDYVSGRSSSPLTTNKEEGP